MSLKLIGMELNSTHLAFLRSKVVVEVVENKKQKQSNRVHNSN